MHKHYSVQVNEAAYEEASEVKQCSLAGVRLLSRNLDHTVIYSPCQAAFSLMRRLGAWFFRRSFHHHHWAVSLSNTRGAASNSNGRSCKKRLHSVSLSVCGERRSRYRDSQINNTPGDGSVVFLLRWWGETKGWLGRGFCCGRSVGTTGEKNFHPDPGEAPGDYPKR